MSAIDDVRAAGYAAFTRGRTLDDNPHKRSDGMAWRAWREGWNNALRASLPPVAPS